MTETPSTATPAKRPGDDAGQYPLRAAHPVGEHSGTHAIVALIRLAVIALGRLHLVGAEDPKQPGAFVLAPVHRSNVDFALTALLTKRTMKYLGKDSIWKSKLLGRFVSSIGAFPVHRGAADREALRACQRMLESGQPVVASPEGTRKTGPVVEELFDGPAYLGGAPPGCRSCRSASVAASG